MAAVDPAPVVPEAAPEPEVTPEPVPEPTPAPAVAPPPPEPKVKEASLAEMQQRQEERRRKEAEEQKRRTEERERAREKERARAEKKEREKAAAKAAAKAADASSPWATAGSAAKGGDAAKPADASNPWGVAAATTGSLKISSKPTGARVSVGGRSRGKTPLKLDLEFGNHEVRVEYPGFATQTRVIKLIGSKPISLDVVLESLDQVLRGTINVVTVGSAVLYVDGARKGRTPLSVSISQGKHRFRFEVDGKPPYEEVLDVKLKSDGDKITHFFALPP